MPNLFIGSSVEGLDVAYTLQEALDFDADVTVWTQDIFKPTATTIESLEARLAKADFAALVFTPDDLMMFRGETSVAPRDNVIFELGLFLGALGRQRCAFIMPIGAAVRLPTDLLGLTPLRYRTDRADGNLIAAIGPSANQLRRMLRDLGSRGESGDDTLSVQGSIQDYLRAWDEPELKSAREILRSGIPFNIQEDEKGAATAALKRVFNFLEGMANAVISGWLDETEVRAAFGDALRSTWARASTYFPVANTADEAWTPPPSLSILAARWTS